jgi:uncharacterized protein (TIGR03437 family)
MPSGLASGGPATVTTTSNGTTVGTDKIDIEAVAPAIFTVAGTGSGAPAAYVLTYSPSGTQTASQNAYTCSGATCTPAALSVTGGQSYLVLYATGVRGATSVVAYIGPTLAPGFTGMNVDATSAIQITPSYAGAQNTDTGLDQLNIQLPATLAGTGTMYLQLMVNGVYPSNTVQLAFE